MSVRRHYANAVMPVWQPECRQTTSGGRDVNPSVPRPGSRLEGLGSGRFHLGPGPHWGAHSTRRDPLAQLRLSTSKGRAPCGLRGCKNRAHSTQFPDWRS